MVAFVARRSRFVILTFLMLGLTASSAFAKPPPNDDACSGLTGGARGLCNAYCNAQGCDENPDRNACQQLRENFRKHTGRDRLPCDAPSATATPAASPAATATNGVPSPSPSGSPAPPCGNGTIDPGEECDTSATGTCPGRCEADCTCAPSCGDDVREDGEICDGSDDTLCPGECRDDCRCAPIGQLAFVVKTGSDLDSGWSGLSHDAVVQTGSTIAGEIGGCDGVTDFTCSFFANVGSFCTADPSRSCARDDECAGAGDTCVISTYGPPLPLSSGGFPTCVVNVFAGDVTGTYDLATGAAALVVPLRSFVYLGSNVSQPCPVCDCGAADLQDCVVGDAGTCSNDATLACTVEATGPFGPTSNTCAPAAAANISGAGLVVVFAPATTGTSSFPTNQFCDADAFTSELCWCDGQPRPNACELACSNDGQPCADDSECPEGTCVHLCAQIAGEPVGEGECPAGPADQRCAGAPEIGCTSDEFCPAGTGPCEAGLRLCFLDPIVREGMTGTSMNVLAATYCIPATTSTAINVSTGLPGPGAVRLPNTITLRICGDDVVNQPSEQCDGSDDTLCAGACEPDCTCPACGNGVVDTGEDCDPPSDDACPGTCAGCRCAAPTCANDMLEAGETCELPAIGCGPQQQCTTCTACTP